MKKYSVHLDAVLSQIKDEPIQNDDGHQMTSVCNEALSAADKKSVEAVSISEIFSSEHNPDDEEKDMNQVTTSVMKSVDNKLVYFTPRNYMKSRKYDLEQI